MAANLLFPRRFLFLSFSRTPLWLLPPGSSAQGPVSLLDQESLSKQWCEDLHEGMGRGMPGIPWLHIKSVFVFQREINLEYLRNIYLLDTNSSKIIIKCSNFVSQGRFLLSEKPGWWHMNCIQYLHHWQSVCVWLMQGFIAGKEVGIEFDLRSEVNSLFGASLLI